MLDKKRGKAYRELMAGLRYHRGEKLSFITFGFKRGSTIDCRMALQKLTQWVKRDKGVRIDYFRVEVHENNSPDEKWRQHIHMLWNAPYIRQPAIVEKLEAYIGEQGSVFIKLLDADEKKTARYLMQYLGNQDGTVHYTMSRNWLPEGYRIEWLALKHEFYERVKHYPRTPLNSAGEVLQEMSCNDDTWRKVVLVDMMNDWIDNREVQTQMALFLESTTYSELKYAGPTPELVIAPEALQRRKR